MRNNKEIEDPQLRRNQRRNTVFEERNRNIKQNIISGGKTEYGKKSHNPPLVPQKLNKLNKKNERIIK